MAPRRPQSHHPITPATLIGIISLILPLITLVRLYTTSGTFLPTLYTFVVSGITFMLYGYDKMQARNSMWRVKEATLHTFAILGGWPGALAGMHYFQHKTRKTAFLVPFWGVVVVWQGVWWLVWDAAGVDVNRRVVW